MQSFDTLKFSNIFDNSPVGLVILNKDSTLRNANMYAFETFQLNPKSVKGKKFGDLFHCAALNSSGAGCGEAKQCQGCSFRLGVSAVLNEGVTIQDTVMDLALVTDGSETKKWFIVSATRVVSHKDVYAVVSFFDISTLKGFEDFATAQRPT